LIMDKNMTDNWPQSKNEFEHFIDKHQDRLIHYAFYRLGNIHDAEDAVQEVFLIAYRKRDKMTKVDSVLPYLYRMTSNACLDKIRKRKSGEVPLEKEHLESLPGGHIDASELAIAREEQKRIQKLLDLLPEKQAEVIRFKIFGELEFIEIAGICKRSVSTVKSRFRYGIEKLRQILVKEQGGQYGIPIQDR